jgi:phage antirepressor YoqD-like protein
MFEDYMQGNLTPEVQAVMRAASDIASGVFSLREAAKFYQLSPEQIIRFMTESAEYDVVFRREEAE